MEQPKSPPQSSFLLEGMEATPGAIGTMCRQVQWLVDTRQAEMEYLEAQTRLTDAVLTELQKLSSRPPGL